MTMQWMLSVLFYYDLIVTTSSTIAGLTYMDNFDFEQKYKDVHECDPFYWHPLHLPEICADMFEKLIRSRIAKSQPVRVMRERERPSHHANKYVIGNIDYGFDIGSPNYESYMGSPNYESYIGSPNYESYMGSPDYGSYIDSPDYGSIIYGKHKRLPMTPYEEMLELLKKDIKKDPSMPKLGVLPNLGPVAIYNQEISKKSETMIKEVATAYAKIGQKSYANYIGYNDSPDPQLYIWDSKKNKTQEYKDEKKKRNKKKSRISRTKTKQGGVVTIVETLEPRHRQRRSVFYLN